MHQLYHTVLLVLHACTDSYDRSYVVHRRYVQAGTQSTVVDTVYSLKCLVYGAGRKVPTQPGLGRASLVLVYDVCNLLLVCFKSFNVRSIFEFS